MAKPTQKTTAPQKGALQFTTSIDYDNNAEDFILTLPTGTFPRHALEAATQCALEVFTPGPEDLKDGKVPPLDRIKIKWSASDVPGTLAIAVITVTRPEDVCVSKKRTRTVFKRFKTDICDVCQSRCHNWRPNKKGCMHCARVD